MSISEQAPHRFNISVGNGWRTASMYQNPDTPTLAFVTLIDKDGAPQRSRFVTGKNMFIDAPVADAKQFDDAARAEANAAMARYMEFSRRLTL